MGDEVADHPDPSETYDPFPRPGDANFASFPKVIPEDTCVYHVYAVPDSLNALQRIQRKSKELEKQYLGRDYIWHRDGFDLKLEEFSSLTPKSPSALTKADPEAAPADGPSRSTKWRLTGSTSHGDSLADEWAIVFLLRTLTRTCPDAWARIEDADGEFLLVEAAHALPRWVEPDVATNRVWIHDGKLLLIPQNIDPTDSGKMAKKSLKRDAVQLIDLEQALAFIARHGDKEDALGGLVHSQSVEDEAFYRLRNHPSPAIEETFHTACVLVPRTLAFVLRRCPAHVSAAVEAFYLRDPIAAKPLLFPEKNTSGLKFVVNDLVELSVKMTRVGYAQLSSQEFGVPPAYGASLFDEEDESKARMTGLKLTAGFEMLCSDPANASKRAVREIGLLLEDLDEGEETLPKDVEIAQWSKVEDDEKWLDVDYTEFEAELDGRKKTSGTQVAGDVTSKAGTKGGQFGDKAAQENLRRIVEQFEKFLNDDDAGPDGAMFGDEDSDDSIGDGSEDENATRGANQEMNKEAQRNKAYLDREALDSADDLSTDEEGDDEGEDKAVSFNEAEFEEMMRQMMGMPPESASSIPPVSSKSFSNTKPGEPAAKTPHQFSFADPQTSGAASKEPTIRERIAALDLDSEPTAATQTPFLTAKAFQHWAAEADSDFEDAADRASYLKKTGLPSFSTTPDATKPQQATPVVKDSSTSNPPNTSSKTSATSTTAPRTNPHAKATQTTRATLQASHPLDTRIRELSDSDDDLLAPPSPATNPTSTPWAADSDGDSTTDDEASLRDMQQAMAAMQAELTAAGVFETDGAVDAAGRAGEKGAGGDEADARYVLAKNLLAAMKSGQGGGGGAGPAASMLSAFGMGLPRDEGDGDGEDEGRVGAKGRGKGNTKGKGRIGPSG